jgi:hypothetical protein
MKSVKRRAVWAGVLVCGSGLALSLSATAGPLDPPAGPVASTYKTLSEVEPRIPIGVGTTPGNALSVFRITQRGSYYLTGNVTGVAGKHGIEIASSGVTLDLNGFEVLGVAGANDGIRTGLSGLSGVVVKNGSVRNWGEDGVDLETLVPRGARVEGVTSSGNGERGIAVGDGAVEGSTATHNGAQGVSVVSGLVTDSFSSENDLSGFLLGAGVTASRSVAMGNDTHGFSADAGALVVDCTARSNGTNGFNTTGPATFRSCVSEGNGQHGFWLWATSSISGSSARANGLHGIVASGSSMVLNNNSTNNGVTGAGAGIRLEGANSRAEGNMVNSNDVGLQVSGVTNIIVRNTAASNGLNWEIAANNLYGPIFDRENPGTPGVNGDAGLLDALGSTHPQANYTH